MSGTTRLATGDAVPVEAALGDGAVDQHPQAKVYDQAGGVLATINLVHMAAGIYRPATPYTMPAVDWIAVAYIVYSDAGHTTENTGYERRTGTYPRIVPDDFKTDISGLPSADDIADQVWDETTFGHMTVDSFGAKNQRRVPSETLADYWGLTAAQETTALLTRKIATNRWQMVNNQLVFFDDDKITPLVTFDLKDAHGNPAMKDVFDRVPL